MKIGIFLGYGPQVILDKEGLGRYLAGLIKGFQERGEKIRIACPHWLLDTLDSLFKDFNMDTSGLDILETGKLPAIWRVYHWLTRKKQKRHRLQRLIAACAAPAKKFMNLLVRVNSVALFGLLCLIPVLFGLVAVIPSAIAGILFVVVKLLGRQAGRLTGLLHKAIAVSKKRGVLYSFSRIQLWTFGQMNRVEVEKLVGIINSDQPMDVWFVPSIFWPQVTGIQNGTVVINAPDLVSEQYAQGFADVLNADNAILNCRETLGRGKYFITYCEYLRQSLLVEEYGINDANTMAIPHVNNAMDGYLYIDPDLKERMGLEKDLPYEYAKCLLPFAVRSASCRSSYPFGFNMANSSYLFYASQARPSKNILNLIKAYEYLLRHRFIHHKLVLTCNIYNSVELNEYITDHALDTEVLCIWNVSVQVLAALYRCADLVVNPTLYEGGFPFTFGEGMSVGTPSVMSDIPQTREVLEPAGLEEILFDPYDWRAMAKKIEWGLHNREELYRKELPLYETLAKRTPKIVAGEYVDAFKRFAQLDGKQIRN